MQMLRITGANILSSIERVRFLHENNYISAPNDYLPVIDQIVSKVKEEPFGPTYELHAATANDGREIAWICYLVKPKEQRTSIFLFVLDQTAPALLQGLAICKIAKHIEWHVKNNPQQAYTFFATEGSNQLLGKCVSVEWSSIIRLTNYFIFGDEFVDGFFYYLESRSLIIDQEMSLLEQPLRVIG